MSFDTALPMSAHAIQLAVAPVFLLTGLAGLLGVMATRLARVIDRARSLEATWPDLSEEQRAAARLEIATLERRRNACSWSINFSTIAAWLVCLVIVALFMEEFFATSLRLLTSALFVAAMLGVIAGLTCFLREVYLATDSTAIDFRHFD